MSAASDEPRVLLTAADAALLLGIPLATLIDWQYFPGAGPRATTIDGEPLLTMFTLSALLDWRRDGSRVEVSSVGCESAPAA